MEERNKKVIGLVFVTILVSTLLFSIPGVLGDHKNKVHQPIEVVEYNQTGNESELVSIAPSEPRSVQTPLARGEIEIKYDDGVTDGETGGFGWKAAVRFTPPTYPVYLKTARLNVGPLFFVDYGAFHILVYDDDGSNGEPGTLLGQVSNIIVTWYPPIWYDVDLSGFGITITSGDFYIAFYPYHYSHQAVVGTDNTSPDYRSFKSNDGSWTICNDWDYMIRAVVDTECGNMGVNPTSWSTTINCGESDNELITVSATGGTVEGVTVSKESGPTWLSVSPTDLGNIPSGSSKTFTMTASPPSETSGDFPYSVRVSNTCGTPSSRDVTGTITVFCPELSYSPESHDLGDMCEGETDSTTFEIWNSGTGTLTYSLSESCDWVEVNPTSGSSNGEHDTITVDIDTTGLSEGSHTCDITINSNDGSGTFTARMNVISCECDGTDTSCGIYPNCENCNDRDGWYCNGNTREYRDYYCSGSSCSYTITSSENCNNYDGWVDAGNTDWVDVNECQEKERKEQEYRDYYCSGGACTYSVIGTKWLDTGNTRNKPDGTICGCTASNTLKRCYSGVCTDTGICNSSICGADAACDGKEPGDSCGGGICDSNCKCGGTPRDDIAITRDYGGMLVWHVDTDRDGSTDLIFSYGAAGDRAVVGDINNDGIDDIAITRDYGGMLVWHVDTDRDGSTDLIFSYGAAGDRAVVGDINNDGIMDDIAITRDYGGMLVWHVDTDRDGSTDLIFSYGAAGDRAVVGDINNDGIDDIAITRDYEGMLVWHVDTDRDGSTDLIFSYGAAGDRAVVGDIG